MKLDELQLARLSSEQVSELQKAEKEMTGQGNKEIYLIAFTRK